MFRSLPSIYYWSIVGHLSSSFVQQKKNGYVRVWSTCKRVEIGMLEVTDALPRRNGEQLTKTIWSSQVSKM